MVFANFPSAVALLSLALLASPAAAEDVAPARPGAEVPAAAVPAGEAPAAEKAAPSSELETLWRRADTLYAARDQPGNLDGSDKALQQAEKLAPGRYETLWRRSRNLFWRGELAPEDDQRERFARRGWDVAEQALKARPGGAEGHYYAAINAGTYGQAIGVLKALTQGVEKPFLDHLRIAMEKAPGLDDGGPATALGRYYYELPWPKYDGKASLRTLRDVVQEHPHNLRARLYLAETLLKEGAPQESLSLVQGVLAAEKGSGDPAETRLVQNRARRLLPKIEEELE